MKRLIPVLAGALLAIFSALLCPASVYAEEMADPWPSGAATPRRISMGVGKSIIVDLPQDAAEIFVANPKIANADAGQTSVFALDPQGRKIAAFELSIGRYIGELQQILRAAMPSAAIKARTVNDTIILTGTVDSVEEAQRAGDIAKGFVQRVFVGGGGPLARPGSAWTA
jgi:pilus assembly protein CpaC